MQQKQKHLSWLMQVGVFALATLAGSAAQAASFDCAKASAKVEKAICADKELSILDDRMAEAYKKWLGAWQGAIAEYVRHDQREFVKLMRSAHEGETDDQLECAKAYVECMRKLLRERVAVLESTAYPVAGVYERKGGKLLLSVKDDAFNVLLFDRASNTIRSTMKYERPGGAGTGLRKDASGYVTSDVLASKLGEGAVGDVPESPAAQKDPCVVRLQMSARQAEIKQSGVCGADFSGKYTRSMRDRVENYEYSID